MPNSSKRKKKNKTKQKSYNMVKSLKTSDFQDRMTKSGGKTNTGEGTDSVSPVIQVQTETQVVPPPGPTSALGQMSPSLAGKESFLGTPFLSSSSDDPELVSNMSPETYLAASARVLEVLGSQKQAAEKSGTKDIASGSAETRKTKLNPNAFKPPVVPNLQAKNTGNSKDDDSPLVEDATDDEIEGKGESGVLSEQVDVTTMTTYPEPRFVMSDPILAAQFVTSMNFRRLKVMDFNAIRACGVSPLKTSIGCSDFTPYDQLITTAAGLYYSVLPDPGFDNATFEVIHSVYALSNNGTINMSENYGEATRAAVAVLSEINLVHVVEKLGSILMKRESIDKIHYLESMNPSECTTILEELRSQFKVMYGIYKMTYQCTHGGVACIEEVPDLICYDPGLEDYMRAVCVGDDFLASKVIPMTVRNPRLKVVSPKSINSVPIIDKSPSESAESAKNKKEYAGPKRNNAGVGKQMVNDPKSLINQGVPSRVQVNRDTTEFRASLDGDQILNENVQLLLDTVVFLNQTVTTLGHTVTEMNGRLVNIERSMATLITQNNQADLAGRLNSNKALNIAASAEASQIISTSPPLVAPNAVEMNDLIERLKSFTNLKADPTLKADLVKLLTACGDKLGVQTVTSASLELPTGRNRLMERLKSCKTKSGFK